MEQIPTQDNPESSSNTEVPQTMQRKHSGLGIISISISIVVVIYTLLWPLLMIYHMREWLPAFPCISPFLSLVALGLGIRGLFQKDHKKIYAIIGTIFSAVILIFFVWLIAMIGNGS